MYISMYICIYVSVKCFNICKRVNIGILVMGDDIGIIGYDRRRLDLSNEPLHMIQDDTSLS